MIIYSPSAAIMQTAFSCRKLLNCNSDSPVLDNLPRKQSDSLVVLLTWTQYRFIKAAVSQTWPFVVRCGC